MSEGISVAMTDMDTIFGSPVVWKDVKITGRKCCYNLSMASPMAVRPRRPAGVNNYVVKPFTTQVLLEKIQGTLTKARQAQ